MLVQGMYSSADADPGEIINVEEAPGDSSWTIADTASDPADASAFFELLNGGSLILSDEGGTGELQPPKTWMNESKRTGTIGELYEVKLFLTSGPAPDGGSPANDTFVDIDTDPRWTWTQDGVGTKNFIGILSCREKADTGNVKTATVSCNLEVV